MPPRPLTASDAILYGLAAFVIGIMLTLSVRALILSH